MNAISKAIRELAKSNRSANPRPLATSPRGQAAIHATAPTLATPPAPDLSGDEPGDGGRNNDEPQRLSAAVSTIRASGNRRAKLAPQSKVGARDGSTIPAKGGAEATTSTKPTKMTPQRQAIPERGEIEAMAVAEPIECPPRSPIIRAPRAASKQASDGSSTKKGAPASTKNNGDGRTIDEAHTSRAVAVAPIAPAESGGGEGLTIGSPEPIGTAPPPHPIRDARDPRIQDVVYNWRLRQRWHVAEKRLVLQSKAMLRSLSDGDKEKANALFDAAYSPFKKAKRPENFDGLAHLEAALGMDVAYALYPFIISIDALDQRLRTIERVLTLAVRQFPIWKWAEPICGVGEMSIAGIIGTAGDVGMWLTVSGLWKRMGLAVINGERQQKKSGVEAALEHGYDPKRRSHVWNLGNGLIGGMGHGPRPFVGEDIGLREEWSEYQRLFVERCRYLAERDNEGRKPVVDKVTGRERESYSAHVANSAKRYVEKRFLRNLYSAWRALERGEPTRAPGRRGNEPQHVLAGRAQIESRESGAGPAIVRLQPI